MLTETEKQDILYGIITGDIINKFFDVLSRKGHITQYCNVYLMGVWDSIPNVNKKLKYLQVLSDQPNSDNIDKIQHWMLFQYAKKGNIHVYDSLNRHYVTEYQKQFLYKALGTKKLNFIFKTVQLQTNGRDCGIFAMAFTVGLLFGEDISNTTYKINEMRLHAMNLMHTEKISCFPKLTDKNCTTSNCKTNSIIIDASLQKYTSYNHSIETNIDLSNGNVIKNDKMSTFIDECDEQEKLCTSLFYDQGIDENIYYNINFGNDLDMEKYIFTQEEIVEFEICEVFPSADDDIKQSQLEQLHYNVQLLQIEHSYCINENKNNKRSKTNLKTNNKKIKNDSSCIRYNDITNKEMSKNRPELINKRLKTNNIDILPQTEIDELYCGKLDYKCQFCFALHFKDELPKDGKFTQCCHKGKVIIERPKSLPLINELLTDVTHPKHKHFKDNIRRYNSAFSFGSCGAQIDTPRGSGPYCYKIHGQIYHKTSHVQSSNKTQELKYAQLYFIDSEEALCERSKINANKVCDKELLKELDLALRKVNPYAQGYKMLKEVHEEQIKNQALINNNNNNNNSSQKIENEQISLIIRKDRNVDCRRYNLPNCNEIAVIFKSDDGAPPFERDIRVYPKSTDKNYFININILSCNLDPMCYTLMFPYGEPGWQPNMISKTNNTGSESSKKITMLQYKSAMLAITDFKNENTLLNYGKVLQQWTVDSYVQVEANNLNYVRNHQTDLRIESYKGLMDYVKQASETNDCSIGKQIILPSSFEGSARNMREKYLDAMAICGHFGTPDLFITFTCNPKWLEITENLLYSQTPSDRPDLISRVFSLKLQELINDIVHEKLFGPLSAYVYTIEFQKRGLPHAHMLFILKNKLLSAEQIDKIISAEIPDAIEYPRLYDIVKNNMIHGPCGDKNPQAYCMENGKCVKGFPKPFQNETRTDVGGYPLYKRRDGVEITKNGVLFDNRYVVPYNKFLSMKYNAHINVEACTTVKSVKYIFKYIYKGYDCASVELLHNGDKVINYDEISAFLNCRYISACEAIWRLFEFKMQDKSHYIIHLAVHLPDEQSVVYKENLEELALENVGSTLTAWFDLNKSNPQSRIYKYTELPYHYVFNKKTKVWTPRKTHFNVVPRMYSVSPKNIELFYLRMLLLHVEGAKSYEDIRTVHGILYETFEKAASAKGLIQNNEGCIRSLEEMSKFEMPAQMRNVFCYMCIFCTQSNPNILWSKFCDVLSEDFQRRYDIETALQKTLEQIDELLKTHNTSCEQLNLPIDREFLMRFNQTENESMNSINMIDEQTLNSLIDTLNEKQLEIFNEVRSIFDDKHNTSQQCFFIDGPGGCGKTYLYNTIIHYVEYKNGIALSFATTGIAALLLQNGRTVHSGFKLPIPVLENSSSFIKAGSVDAEKLKTCDLIIIDECSMMDKYMLECIDRLLQFIMENDCIFGNKIIILGGDFRQTLPVIVRASPTAIIERCLKHSRLWRHFRQFSLTENMRCKNNDDFNKWLLKIGSGKINNDDNIIQFDEKYVSKDIITDIYQNDFTIDSIRSKIIVCVKNDMALQLNNQILDLLNTEEMIYYSADSVESDDANEADRYPIDFLYSLTPSGMPPHELRLKVGSVVMLLRNLNVKAGLCNGTRLIVKKLFKYVIECDILTGKHTGDKVHLPQIDLVPSDTTLPFKLKRTQFPIIPAFVITINKSQGQTFDYVGISLIEEVFSHGQLYTALSRVTTEQHLKIQLSESSNLCTKNIVYKEVL